MVCETNVTIKCGLAYVSTAAKANRRRLWRLAVAPQPPIAVIRNFVPPRKSLKFLTLRRFYRHNICIPNAQYYELSAQQNLWCEILEFWALGDNAFIHSELCDFRTKHYEIRLANEPLLYAIAPLLHSNSATIIMQ